MNFLYLLSIFFQLAITVIYASPLEISERARPKPQQPPKPPPPEYTKGIEVGTKLWDALQAALKDSSHQDTPSRCDLDPNVW